MKATKRVLVVSPVPTHPLTAGNRARVFSVCSELKSYGFDVTFAYVAMEQADRDSMEAFFGTERLKWVEWRPPSKWRHIWLGFSRVLSQRPRGELPVDYWYSAEIEAALESICATEKFDVIVANYIFFSRALELVPNARKVLDTHDVFTDRHSKYLAAGMTPQWFSTSMSQERLALERANLVIAIQPEEAEFFQRLLGRRRVAVVGHIAPIADVSRAERSRTSAVYLGSSNPINIAGLTFFVEHVMPLILKRIANFCLLIVGEVGSAFADRENVCAMGVVRDLGAALGRASIAINPAVMGTGLSIKTIDALRYGLPVVSTASGSRGLSEELRSATLIVPDYAPLPFAEAVCTLLSDDAARERLSLLAIDGIGKWNAEQSAALLACIGD